MAIDGGTFFNENSRTLAPEAVGSQVAIMSIVSVSYIGQKIPNESEDLPQLVTVVLFNLLRPKNKV